MTLTLQEVEHIALLARLQLSEQEKALYQKQLSEILDYVAQLQKLDTTAQGEPHPEGMQPACLREDEPRLGLTTEEALRNAPGQHGRQFRVPPVLD